MCPQHMTQPHGHLPPFPVYSTRNKTRPRGAGDEGVVRIGPFQWLSPSFQK